MTLSHKDKQNLDFKRELRSSLVDYITSYGHIVCRHLVDFPARELQFYDHSLFMNPQVGFRGTGW